MQNFIYIHDETTLQTNFQQVDKKRATGWVKNRLYIPSKRQGLGIHRTQPVVFHVGVYIVVPHNQQK